MGEREKPYGKDALASPLNSQSAPWALPLWKEEGEIYWKYILDLLERRNRKEQQSSTRGESIKRGKLLFQCMVFHWDLLGCLLCDVNLLPLSFKFLK